ncbi:hypothetical protein ABIE00_004722 [Arthrobacter sp. OAP107]
MEPRTIWTSTPNGRSSRVAMGSTQALAPDTPDVGSQPRVMANTQIPTMASQKSGIEAAAMETKLEIRSAMPFGFSAAQHPTASASSTASTMVVAASCRVAGKARSAMAAASCPVRSDCPKSSRSTPPK